MYDVKSYIRRGWDFLHYSFQLMCSIFLAVYFHAQFLAPALRGISIQIEVDSLAATKSASSGGQGDKVLLGSGRVVELVEPQDCVPVENALVTFTTGSTGLPKLMLRQHK